MLLTATTLRVVGKGPRRTNKKAEPTGNGPEIKVIARNRRARHEYDIIDIYECGLELRGSEVKSLRANKVAMGDAYARCGWWRTLAVLYAHCSIRPSSRLRRT